MIFLCKFGYNTFYVNRNKFSSILKDIVKYCQNLFLMKLEKYVSKEISTEVIKLFKTKDAVKNLFMDFYSTKINKILFPFDCFEKDKGFRVCCDILNFVKLKDLY